MTNHPTDDDFDETKPDAPRPASFDENDDEAAAFGERRTTPVVEEIPKTTPAEEPDIAEQYDDSDFITDDAEDVLETDEEYAAATDAEYTEETVDEDYDPLADDADPYPNAEEIYEQPASQKERTGGLMGKFNAMKTGDRIFYGGMGVAGLIALYFAFAMTMGQPPKPQETLLTADSVQPPSAAMPAPTADATPQNAPIANPAEPKPDAIGIQGAQSTLNNDTLAPLPQAVPDAPPANVVQLQTGQIPEGAAPAPLVQEQIAPQSAEADQLKSQLEAQNQAMHQLQEQIVAQQRSMQDLQEQAAKPLTTVTTPPAIVKSDNPVLNQLATDIGVRLAELNARLTQLGDNIGKLEQANTQLDKQNADLVAKTKELSDKLGVQSTKLTDLANKEPPPSPDKQTIESLRATVAQLEKKLSDVNKTQGSLVAEQEKASARLGAVETTARSGTYATLTNPKTPEYVAATPALAAAAPAPVAQAAPKPQPQPTPIKPVASKPTSRDVAKPKPAPQPRVAEEDIVTAPVTAPQIQVDVRSPKTRGLQAPVASDSTWVLRAATPTMAWLSPRPGSPDLRRVAPGDTVEGLGRIIEIRQEMGRWAVIGTVGSVR